MVLKITRGYYSLHYYTLTVKKENPVSLKNVFDELMTINSLNLDLLCCILSIQNGQHTAQIIYTIYRINHIYQSKMVVPRKSAGVPV